MEPKRTCTLKLYMPICKVCFSLEKGLFCAKCAFSTTNSPHFGAQTLKDIIKVIPSLKAYCVVSHAIIWRFFFYWSFFKYKMQCCQEHHHIEVENYLL